MSVAVALKVSSCTSKSLTRPSRFTETSRSHRHRARHLALVVYNQSSMLFPESLGRRAAVTVVATGGILWFLEARIFDSQRGWSRDTGSESVSLSSPPGRVVSFSATAYCVGRVTSAGVTPQRGVVAADPAVLPAGSIVEIDTGEKSMTGLYTVLDTGPKVKGRRVDLYMKNCGDALRFGRRTVRLTVLRHGWSPAARPMLTPAEPTSTSGFPPAGAPAP